MSEHFIPKWADDKIKRLEASERELQQRVTELERKAAWAATFTCPKCGECSNGMVTTKKTCLHCDSLLVRSKSPALQEAEATVAVLSAALEEVQWAAGYLPLAKPEPCCPVCHVSPDSIGGHRLDCRLSATLANLPAAAREHLARDAEWERALAAAQGFVNAYRIKPAIERPPLELPDDA